MSRSTGWHQPRSGLALRDRLEARRESGLHRVGVGVRAGGSTNIQTRRRGPFGSLVVTVPGGVAIFWRTFHVDLRWPIKVSRI